MKKVLKNNSNSIENTVFSLSILCKARVKMLLDFILPQYKPDLHRDMFRYENSPVAMEQIIKKYFLYWIKEHWNIFNNAVSNLKESEKQKNLNEFYENLILLLQKFDYKYQNRELIENILKTQENIFNQLLENAKNVNKIQNSMEFLLERKITLIERELAMLNL